jgi:dTDP-4-amino-4,6-dideoxygalactose transaminase
MGLEQQFKLIEDEVRRGCDMASGPQNFIMSPEVAKLEEKLVAWAGTHHALGISNNTDALV